MKDDYVGTQADTELLLAAKDFFVDALPPRQPVAIRKSRRVDPEVRALRHFVNALELQSQDSRRAAILYLADRYLGLKPRNFQS